MPTKINNKALVLADNFHFHASYPYVDVGDLMRRSTQDGTKTFCLIRGPPSSGKGRCAAMMLLDLDRLGNTSAVIVDDTYNHIKTSVDLFNALQDQYMDEYKFVIAILPSGLFDEYIQFYQLGVAKGFDCYTIELYPRGNRAPWVYDSIPEHHILLDISTFNAPPPPQILFD